MTQVRDLDVAPAHSGAPPADGMVWIPGGEFTMGADDGYPEEAPARRVAVGGLWMDRFPVTNAAYARFVDATGHRTAAERAPDLASAVFHRPRRGTPPDAVAGWWRRTEGADWRHPRGPRSTLRGLDTHPVVHVAWDDVAAYARWAGKDVATEAEWERAARGGLDGAAYPWGDHLEPGGRHMANVWQGRFPTENRCLDGFEHTSPLRAFPPNAFGLFDMIGNVWEWTSDRYEGPADVTSGCCTTAAEVAAEVPARVVAGGLRHVLKGGSHLCSPDHCRRYRPAARRPQAVGATASHVGFRCVVRV